ncbi:MAG: ATP-dependent helicase [Ardenticatenaceae bacterium]|nr:ATP-dependent helicase [Ardenticatenaceae bacterium]
MVSWSELTTLQQEAANSDQTSFLLGPAGAGKTTTLQHRLLRLLAAGEPAYTLLVLVAEPEHQQGYLEAVHQSGQGPYADLKITTYTQMAQEMVSLFWPLVARPAGFDHPYQPPTFLSYDLAQLLMWRIITGLLADGAFSDLRLRPQQIVSQLLDTLNRAALNGLSLQDAIERQIDTWVGEPDRVRHLHDAATAVSNFRRHCLQHSLLDLSLAVEVFDTQLVKHPEFHRYFRERFRHLIVDNIEEQTPAGQNFVASLMNATQTTAIAFDAGGGYKRFMAADPLGANQFRAMCSFAFAFEENFIAAPPMAALSNLVENFLMHTTQPTLGAEEGVLRVVNGRYRREMIAQLVAALADLVEEGVPTNKIAIIVPYLDGALRYMLTQALGQAGLPYFLLRRRSSPREEPRIRAWLTWLALAHPAWGIAPTDYDVAEALTLSIAGLDPARAGLLTERLYQPKNIHLLPVSELPDWLVERIGSDMVGLVEALRLWIEGQDPSQPIDTFLYNLFNDLLAQPRFQPVPDLAGAAVCDWLVQSATRLRQAAQAIGLHSPAEIGTTFIDGINQGLVTANPPDLGDPPDPNGIMISTIYGYLLAGYPMQVQVWLETAATGWWDIPKQPLSNAFVLAQSRSPGEPWTTDEEFAIRNQLLSRIIRGLTNRCTGQIILANSDLDRRGLRQDGPLWRALQPARVTSPPE